MQRAELGRVPRAVNVQTLSALQIAAPWGVKSHLCQVKAGDFINSVPCVSSPRARVVKCEQDLVKGQPGWQDLLRAVRLWSSRS